MIPHYNHMQNDTAAEFREIAGAVLKEGLQLSFRAGGRSMTPFIRDNETVILEPPPITLRLGDVILFARKDGHLTLHRIVKKTVNGYLTRGDAQVHQEGPVAKSEVLGRAVRVVGGLSFHLWFPLSALISLALSIRKRPRLFPLLRIPGLLLLRSLQIKHRGRVSAKSD